MRKNRSLELVVVIFISIVMAVFGNIGFLTGTLQTPPDAVYLGVTHYFQDYFLYLSHVVQGMRGWWLTHYLFTSEYVTPNFQYWPNILLGHIGSILHVSPITMFNSSVYILLFIMLAGTYFMFKRIFPKKHLAFTGFLFFVFSTSVLNRLPKTAPFPYWPFELWGTRHLIVNRLSTLPHHIIQTILFCGILIVLFDEQIRLRPWIKWTLLGIQIALLTVLQPVFAGMIVGCYVLSCLLFKNKNHLTRALVLIIGFLIPFLFMVLLYQNQSGPDMYAGAWDAKQQTLTTTWFLLLSIGPIVPFALAGIILRIKRLTQIEWFGLLLVLIGYILFRFPSIDVFIGISNARVTSTGCIIILAWFAATGADAIAQLVTKQHTKWKSLVFTFLFMIFFLAVTPTIIWEVKQKINVNSASSPVVYIPKTTYKAFEFLAQDQSWQKVVLANPISFSDSMVPALSGHKTYSGHMLITIRSDEKVALAKAFFLLSMSQSEAKNFLQTIPVSYVLFTNSDGNVEQFQTAYPFLTPIFSTPTATVFKTQ